MRGPLNRCLAAVGLGMAIGWATPTAPAAAAANEYSVKAAFLYQFAKYVEWPAAAFDPPAGVSHFCVFGDNPFGPVLAQTLAGKLVHERPVQVELIGRVGELQRCHLVFLPAAAAGSLPKVVAALGRRPVLLVGESAGFAERGGMINFIVEDGSVRFEINPRVASASGLRISSKLLELARIVDKDGRW